MKLTSTLVNLFLILSLSSIAYGTEVVPDYSCSFGTLNPAEMYPTDIAVDSQGNVFILDELNRRVHKRNKDNNILLLFGSAGHGDGQFSFPRSIALDSEGKIYVTDGIASRIQKFDVDGSFVLKWGITGTGDGEFDMPGGIAVSSAGMVYIADMYNSRIQVFDQDGNFLFKWGEKGTTEGKMLKPYYIAFDSENNVWVTDETAHRVIKYDQTGNYILSFGTRGTSPGEFIAPTGIAIDQNNYVYIYDRWNFRIQKFDQDGNFITMWGNPGSGDGELHGLGMASDDDSNVYIADYWNFRAQKFSPTGQFLCKWTGTVTGDGEFAYAHDLIVNHSGNVYVVDRINQNVQVFDSVGNFLFKWGSRGKREDHGPFFNFPRAIGVDSEDNVYISNDKDLRIFDLNGSFLDYWAIDGIHFPGPLGVTTDKDDHVFFTTTYHEVCKMDKYGNMLASWGSYGNDIGQFNKPAGIGADSEGNVYVNDMLNSRVQKFSNDGDFILTWGSNGNEDGQFKRPVGLAIDPENCVYVVDSVKNQIQKFDSNGNFLLKWGTFGNAEGEFNSPHYIAIDDSGTDIYVTDSGNGRVQKFSLEPVSLSLMPDTTIIQQEGVLGFQASFINNTNKYRVFYFATNVKMPNGTIYPPWTGYLYGPNEISLAPYETKAEYVVYDVPPNAPLGEYVYNGYVGKGILTIWDEEHFEFTITSPGVE